MKTVPEPDLIRALRVLALSNQERMKLIANSYQYRDLSGVGSWFLENINDLAPALHKRGWVEYAEFTHTPGQVVVTTGQGDVRAVVITELGRQQLNVAVAN